MDAVKALDDIYVYVCVTVIHFLMISMHVRVIHFLNGIFNVYNTILWLQGYFKYFLLGVLYALLDV